MFPNIFENSCQPGSQILPKDNSLSHTDMFFLPKLTHMLHKSFRWYSLNIVLQFRKLVPIRICKYVGWEKTIPEKWCKL